jgi:hypothetical protein
MNQWDEVYRELQNKIRWAISTTSGNVAINIPFKDAMAMASMCCTPILEAFKAVEEHPDLSTVLMMEKLWSSNGSKAKTGKT